MQIAIYAGVPVAEAGRIIAELDDEPMGNH